MPDVNDSNGHATVRASTREKGLAAIDELGCRPNGVARSLRTHQTHTLGLVISDVLNPFFTALARAVEEEARVHGYSVIIGNADEQVALGAMDEMRARGLRVPGDIALAAFDDIPWFLHTDPPLTAIEQPTEELGHSAVRALIDPDVWSSR